MLIEAENYFMIFKILSMINFYMTMQDGIDLTEICEIIFPGLEEEQ